MDEATRIIVLLSLLINVHIYFLECLSHENRNRLASTRACRKLDEMMIAHSYCIGETAILGPNFSEISATSQEIVTVVYVKLG